MGQQQLIAPETLAVVQETWRCIQQQDLILARVLCKWRLQPDRSNQKPLRSFRSAGVLHEDRAAVARSLLLLAGVSDHNPVPQNIAPRVDDFASWTVVQFCSLSVFSPLNGI